MQGIYEHRAPDQSAGPARRTVLRETSRSLVDRDAQPQLADVRVATRVGQRVPVPVRRETDAAPNRDVVTEAEQQRATGLAGAPEAADPGAYGAEAQTTGQEETEGPTTEQVLRIERLEAQIRQLTGTIEQLQYRNQQLENQLRGGPASARGPLPGNGLCGLRATARSRPRRLSRRRPGQGFARARIPAG